MPKLNILIIQKTSFILYSSMCKTVHCITLFMQRALCMSPT